MANAGSGADVALMPLLWVCMTASRRRRHHHRYYRCGGILAAASPVRRRGSAGRAGTRRRRRARSPRQCLRAAGAAAARRDSWRKLSGQLEGDAQEGGYDSPGHRKRMFQWVTPENSAGGADGRRGLHHLFPKERMSAEQVLQGKLLCTMSSYCNSMVHSTRTSPYRIDGDARPEGNSSPG